MFAVTKVEGWGCVSVDGEAGNSNDLGGLRTGPE